MSRTTIKKWYEPLEEKVIDLYIEVFSEPPWNESWRTEEVRKDIEYGKSQKDFVGYIAVDSNDNVIGFTWGYALPLEKFPFLSNLVREVPYFYVDELAVKRDYRRRGIGRSLTLALLREAKEKDYKYAILRTDVRGGAYKFYEKLGFEDTGKRDPQYPERTYMGRKLDDNL